MDCSRTCIQRSLQITPAHSITLTVCYIISIIKHQISKGVKEHQPQLNGKINNIKIMSTHPISKIEAYISSNFKITADAHGSYQQNVISIPTYDINTMLSSPTSRRNKKIFISQKRRARGRFTSCLLGDRMNEIRMERRISCLAYLIWKGCVEKLLSLSLILHTPYISSQPRLGAAAH